MTDVSHTDPTDAPSPITMVTQITSTGWVVQLAGSLTPWDQTEEEKWYVLIVTTSVRALNLEMTRVILSETMTASVGELAPENPQMEAIFSGLTKAKRVVGHPSATIEEVTGKELERVPQ